MPSDLQGSGGRPPRVLVAGGGVAGLEALLALRELAMERASLELIAPAPTFTYKPLAVAEPFGLGPTTEYDLARIAEERSATLRVGQLAAVDADGHAVRLTDGGDRPYDALVIALGARMSNPLPGSIVVQGPGYTSRFSTLLRELQDHRVHRVAFAVPAAGSWPLPLYELALMAAARVAEGGLRDVELSLVTPEGAPLEIFGAEASSAVQALLSERGIDLHTNSVPAAIEPDALVVQSDDLQRVPADRVVSLPRLDGPGIEGLPSDSEGFIPVDEHGLVEGELDVYAAGDVTAFPVKQGGLATQQADAVAEAIAARAGAPVSPAPFRPVLRGMLLTGGVPRYLRHGRAGSKQAVSEAADHALWWPPGKIAGRYLSPYLALHGETIGRRPDRGDAIPVEVPLEETPRGVRRRAIIASPAGSRAVMIPLDPQSTGVEPDDGGR